MVASVVAAAIAIEIAIILNHIISMLTCGCPRLGQCGYKVLVRASSSTGLSSLPVPSIAHLFTNN